MDHKEREVDHDLFRKRIVLVKRKLGGLGFLVRRSCNAVPYIINVVKGGEAEARGVEVGYIIETGGLSYEQIVDKLARVPVGKAVTISFKTVVKRKVVTKPARMEEKVGEITNGSELEMAINKNGLQTKQLQDINVNDHEIKQCDMPHAKNDKKYTKLKNFVTMKETIDTLYGNSEVCFISYSVQVDSRRPELEEGKHFW